MTAYKINIPSELMKALRDQFVVEAKRVCKDVAYVLKVSEKDLIKNVVDSQQMQINIIDNEGVESTCVVPMFMINGSEVKLCRRPCLLGTERCQGHQHVRTLPQINAEKKITRIHIESAEHEPLWCDETTSCVYNEALDWVGNYCNGELMIFKFNCV